jgi:hypothetical protein
VNELPLAELSVATAASHQLLVAAALDHAPAVKYQNLIGLLHGGQPVGNYKHGAAGHGLV